MAEVIIPVDKRRNHMFHSKKYEHSKNIIKTLPNRVGRFKDWFLSYLWKTIFLEKLSKMQGIIFIQILEGTVQIQPNII